MVITTAPGTEIFLDTAYAIALSSVSDEHHEKAVLLSEELEANQAKLLITRAVIFEIGNALAKQRYRQAAVELLLSIEEDPNVEIIPVSEDLCERAFQLYRNRPDKEWGLTDCISFVIMRERGITVALTTDEHFIQAGFEALLR